MPSKSLRHPGNPFAALWVPVLAICVGILVVTLSVLWMLSDLKARQVENTSDVKAVARQVGVAVH